MGWMKKYEIFISRDKNNNNILNQKLSQKITVVKHGIESYWCDIRTPV